MPKGNFVKKDKEILEIEARAEAYKAKRWWTNQFTIASIVFYFAGAFTIWTQYLWITFMIVALILWVVRTVLDLRDHKEAHRIGKLLDAYHKKKTRPFYMEALDKFGDDYHVHHNDDGSISLKDRKLDVRPDTKSTKEK